MICPRCSVAEISPDTNRCELCGYTLLGSRPVAVQPRVADEVFETVQRELAGRFEMHVLVRRDRGSTLYLARDLEDDQLVGLRLIPRHGPVEGPLIHRFAQTATLAAQLRHPHLLPIRKHGVSTSLLWYSMDAVKSRTLGATLDAAGQLPLARTIEFLEQIASGLEYLHRNAVVHGGVGRETVLVDGEGWVRVADPGTAAAVYRAAGPGLGWEGMLDLPFAAPELIERRLMGPAADQYSLAVIAYTCLAGRTPYAGTSVDELRRERAAPAPSLLEVRPDIPPHVDTAVQRAMRDDPTDRFGSVLDFVAVLGGAAVRATGAVLRPTGRPGAAQVVVVPTGEPVTRRWGWAILALLAVGGAAAGGAYFALRPSAVSDQRWADGPTQAAPAPPPVVTPRPVGPATSPPAATGRARDPAPTLPPAAPAPAPTGTVFVNATPWGSVYVDGRLVGNTPQTDLRLAAGAHTLRVVRDGFVPFEREVMVRSGDTLRITDIVLEPIRP
jgi:serine/threonine-protein kinase